MINPIIPQDKKELKPVNYIDDERFKQLINEIYSTMLTYSRLRKKPLNKNNVIRIGNVSFWFETYTDGEAQLKFSKPVKLWDETAVVNDLEQHFHDLHFNPVTT